MKCVLGVLAAFLFLAVAASAEDRAGKAAKPAAKAPASAEQAKPQFKLNLKLPNLSSEQPKDGAKPAVQKPLRTFHPVIDLYNPDNDNGHGCTPWWVCGGECNPNEGC